MFWTGLLFMMLLTACTSDVLKRAAYESLYHNQCMDDTGYQDCDPNRLSYDEYTKIREAELKGKRIDR